MRVGSVATALAALAATTHGSQLQALESTQAAPAVEELGDESFDRVLGKRLVTCVLFYQTLGQQSPMSVDTLSTLGIFEQVRGAAQLLAAAGKDVTVASMSLDGNPRTVRRVAATGPVSLKLFDRRLPAEASYDVYALHVLGPRFKHSSTSLFNLLADYVDNSTGVAALDALAHNVLKAMPPRPADQTEDYGEDGDYEEEAGVLSDAVEAMQDEAGRHRNGPAYVAVVANVLHEGLPFIARTFNEASLALGRAHLALAEQARLLLLSHISAALSGPLLGEDASVPRSRASRPAEEPEPRKDLEGPPTLRSTHRSAHVAAAAGVSLS